MNTEATLLKALHADPRDGLAWLALADCWEEAGDDLRAEHLRLMLWLADHLDDEKRPAREARLRRIMASGFVPRLPGLSLALDERTKLEVTLIHPGGFDMGSDLRPAARGAEHPRHRVRLTEPFYIARAPTTQAEWAALTGTNPANYPGHERPVECVNWADCQEFCRLLARRAGRPVRLPTEAEWEYCCRAGTSTAYYTGDTEEGLRRAAWYGVRGNETRPVRKGEPNGWGLYDMLGNVWEWTRDAFAPYPKKGGERTNPRRISESSQRAARGGSYSNGEECCKCSGRISFAAGGRNTFIGFRVVVECPAR
jgi:uncharacterized protein (TIGR02996 family)